jgi:hypothetical protein
MTIVVNPHTQQEEEALLKFLDNMKFDYSKDEKFFVLSSAQQEEILKRDRQYEAGEATVYTLDEIVNHFGIKEK